MLHRLKKVKEHKDQYFKNCRKSMINKAEDLPRNWRIIKDFFSLQQNQNKIQKNTPLLKNKNNNKNGELNKLSGKLANKSQ
jgi:hypothetical protein